MLVSENIDKVFFNERAHKSVNYAMARHAIEADAATIAKANAARAKTWAVTMKSFVIEELGGNVVEGKKGRYVEFSDQSKAKF